MAATSASARDMHVLGESLRWYNATEEVQYGFCTICGSTLFWRASDKPDRMSIAAGTLDTPTDLRTTTALFVDDASDYHRLDETLERFPYDH
jgi:hypothetical protein